MFIILVRYSQCWELHKYSHIQYTCEEVQVRWELKLCGSLLLIIRSVLLSEKHA